MVGQSFSLKALYFNMHEGFQKVQWGKMAERAPLSINNLHWGTRLHWGDKYNLDMTEGRADKNNHDMTNT